MCGVWLSESPNGGDGVGGWQPLTTNESTQMHDLICHTCNEHIPAVLPYTNVNLCINTCKHQWTLSPTHNWQQTKGGMNNTWYSSDLNALMKWHTRAT